MAAVFLDPIMDKALELITEKLISAGLRYVKDQVGWQKRRGEELKKLQKILPQIQAIVHFTSNLEQITDQHKALNKWYWQFRNAIDDANDVLDELEYMELEKQVTKNKKLRRVRSIMKFTKKKLVKIGRRALKRDPIFTRLEEAVQELYRVSTTGVDTFHHLVDRAKQEQKEQLRELYVSRETGSLPKNDLIGRGKEKEVVMEWLRNPSNDHGRTDLYRNISLLCIMGHGGMGKTTISQHVYKDEEITKEFDLKMWVCVSNNFDPKEVIADMLELLKKKRPRLETLEALQDSLCTEIKSKKFLLVLDDIWEDENGDISKWEVKWGNVLASLADGGFGSKIMVTTRTDSVAQMFAKVIKKKKEIVKLQGLEEDECLQLLNSHAFAGVDPDDHKKLRVIAGEIVKKLLGSPLAAKVIGGLLNNNLDERSWRRVLESNLLGKNSVAFILRLSYIALSNPLRSCFAFCCLFKQDHKYDKDDLIRMWIALGFIEKSQGQTFEDVGESHFEDLVKKTLLEKVGNDYKMHDLIHESASQFFAQEYGKFVDDEELSVKISETIRYLSVEVTNLNIIKKIGQFKNLHSLFLFYEKSYEQYLYNDLREIFKASRSLRLLYICSSRSWLKKIPENIGNLIHLRYLRIFCYNMTMLPRSLSNLYYLQYLIYDGFKWRECKDDFLPSDINNLSNLRYVQLSKKCILSICGIGKLTSLQELHEFKLRDASGYRIGELKNMNDLCILGINCLENVKNAEEACSAKLYDKKRLTDLTLCWSTTDSRNINLNQNVLDKLKPPECLRNLSIQKYMGSRSAIWMNNVNPIFNLEKIELEDCLECATLPPFGQLPFLKSLKLSGMPKVKWLECKFNGNDKYRAFPSLEKLCIVELEALEDWFEAGVAAAEDVCFFPCLIQLKLRNCPKLKELPPKLKRLEISKTGWTALNFYSNSNPIPLETLKVLSCPNITSIPLADEIARLIVLRHLDIDNCPNISDIHLADESLQISDPSVLLMEPLRSIASLKKLNIKDNDEVVSFPNEAEQWFLNVSSSLCELEFSNLKSLESLPSSLESLSSLRVLHIQDLPMLRELPNFPPSLESLYILGCLNITSLSQADEIARLPAIRHLEIHNCPNISYVYLADESLQISDPSVLLMEPLRSIASLKKLTIRSNDELVSFSNEAVQWFLKDRSSLSELTFWNLKSLESLPSSLESLSSLQNLHIENVPLLWELPNLPPNLQHLGIYNVTLLRELPNLSPNLQHLNICDVPMLRELPNLPPNLQWLYICHLPMLRELPNLPPNLQDLYIGVVPMLRELPNLPPNLQDLYIQDVPMLRELPNLPPNLEELNIQNVPMLRELPNLPPNLQDLYIQDVPMLRELPNLPPNLQLLRIWGCHPELKERYGEDGASDRHNIAYIPRIEFRN